MSGVTTASLEGVRARLAPILPVLVAEAILWLGFGALLPVLPLYLTEQGSAAAGGEVTAPT